MKVKEGSAVKIKYIGSNVIQDVVILTRKRSDEIRRNRDLHAQMKKKEKKEFEKNNTVKFETNQVTPDSPIGKAILGLPVGDIGTMTLPVIQGGNSAIKVISVK